MSNKLLQEKMMEYKDEMIAAIAESIRIPSVKGEPLEGAPYGAGPKKALMHALELAEKMGFKTGNVDNRVGWAEIGEGEEMVGILGHLDVVPEGEGWNYPPFGGEIHDGYLWGRGCLDDKGPTIGAFYVMKAIRELGLPIDRRIRVLFGTDEENGSSCVQYYVDNGYEMPTIGFTPDAEYPAIFFEKEMFPHKLGKNEVVMGEIPVEYFGGGTASNVVTPTCKLVAAGDLKVTAADGVTVTKEDGKTIVEAAGIGAHGSTPHLGVNAAIKLLHAVKDNHFGGTFQNYMDFILKYIDTNTDGALMDICFTDEETGTTSMNLGVLNFTKDGCSFTLDIRTPNHTDGEKLVANIAKCASEFDLEVLTHGHTDPLYIPKDSELITKLVAVYANETGKSGEPIAIGGGTYAKHFKNMVAFGPTFPEDPSVIHQPNERMEIDTFMKSMMIIAEAMLALATK